MKFLIELESEIDQTQNEIKKFQSLPEVQEPALLNARYKNLHDLTFRLVSLQEKYQSLQQRHAVQDVQMDVLNMSEKLADENEIAE